MTKKELRYFKIIPLLIIAIAYAAFRSMAPAPYSQDAESGKYFYVNRVIDGDTLKLSNGQKVRLIGVDTPEVHLSAKLLRDARRAGSDAAAIQKMGKRATQFTKDLVAGKQVRLEYDVTKRDKYNRSLAYVYLYDGTFVNARIIEEGFGQVMTIPPNVKYAGYFLKLERAARDSKKGLWGEK